MAAVASAVVAGMMGFFTLSAANAVKDTFENSKDEIDAIPFDEEVKAADEIAQQKSAAYSTAVVWSKVPAWAKMSLLLSVGSMIVCVYLLAMFNTQCFAEYDLMYTISDHLGGQWHNLVKPLGRYALLCIVISHVFLFIFQTWASVGVILANEFQKRKLHSPSLGFLFSFIRAKRRRSSKQELPSRWPMRKLPSTRRTCRRNVRE